MPTYLKITSGPLAWSRYKIAQEVRDIKVDLARRGVQNALVEVMDHKPNGAAPPEPTLIHFKCQSCGTAGGTWYSAAFTACPTCGQRKSVVKATVKKVPVPAGATVV